MNFMPAGNFYDEAITTSRSSSSSSHRYAAGGGVDETHGDDHNSMLFMRVGAAPATAVQKEHMFDKVVTPSDVGKLNRLVIPKQHAEKYFPLDSSSNEKGLLLNFEDRNGKPWRFRYSYWNSSQSYVMTKGWSRFVKEKQLDAGDIVSFQRGADESAKDRLFIDWRRRPDAPPYPHIHHRPPNPWGPLFMHHQQQKQPPQPPTQYYHHHHYNSSGGHHHHHHPYGGPIVNGNPCSPGTIMYLSRDGGGPAAGLRGVLAPGPHIHHHVIESVPVVVQAKATAAPKRLRLFGVNMDCPNSDDDDDDHHIIINTNNNNNDNNNILMASFDSSSSSSSLSLARLRHSEDDKGKGSMSLDLDI